MLFVRVKLRNMNINQRLLRIFSPKVLGQTDTLVTFDKPNRMNRIFVFAHDLPHSEPAKDIAIRDSSKQKRLVFGAVIL